MSAELSFAGVSQSEIDEIRQLQSEILVAVKMTIDKVIDAGGSSADSSTGKRSTISPCSSS